ncbi:hypothetical protein [Arthrobacter pityocampae]|uniref:hypothetical protein n=1 Tax=Arthrobacter pityocampae TaxID=547334 RepID=UPI003736216F
MNIDETKAILTLANALDPRVQVNKPTLDLWAKVLHGSPVAACHAAVSLFYERYAEPTNRPVVDAPMIRRIISHETERAAAVTQAIEPRKPVLTEPRIRQRVLDRFRDEYEAGRRQGNGERAYNTAMRATGDHRQAQAAQREAEAAA